MLECSDPLISLVDAYVIAIVERLEQDAIATLDRRRVFAVRPLHIDAFDLVP
jgi:hypothetical protein